MGKNMLEITSRMKYYLENYNCIFTYVHNMEETQPIIDYSDKVCRFCGKRYPEVKFKKKAHAVSELLGNKEFVLKNECDNCNIFFGHKLEDDLGKYIGLSRTLSQIFGKEGVPSYKAKDGSWRIDYTNKGPVIQMKENATDIEEIGNSIVFHAVRDSYTPIAVYKALVKMSLSLLPYDKMPSFMDTVAWIKEDSHIVSKFNMDKYAHMIERFIPGPKPLQLRASGFLRKNDALKIPYYLFLLEFANYSYQIIVPCEVKDSILAGQETVEFVPIPGADESYMGDSIYGISVSKLVDLTKKTKTKGETIDLCLSFEKKEVHEGIGETINEFFELEGIELKKRL